MLDLIAGRAAVVTGGARGIGLAVVEAIAARGVGVLCLDHPDADYGAFHDACRLAGVPADHVGVDVRDQWCQGASHGPFTGAEIKDPTGEAAGE